MQLSCDIKKSIKNKYLQIFSLIFSFLQSVQAEGLLVPLNGTGTPADDLIYQGHNIDENEATGLKRNGFDLSTLNPKESTLWKNKKLSITNEAFKQLPPDGATVDFNSYLRHSKGLFRSRVEIKPPVPLLSPKTSNAKNEFAPESTFFRLTVSLENHGACLRAALLRKMGYDLTSPKYYNRLTLRFGTIEERNTFLDNLADKTITSRTRWIADLPTNQAQVTLQGVALEPSELTATYSLHWPQMDPSYLKGRRVFRGLIVPWVLTDLDQNINSFTWETGQTFSDSVALAHLFGDAFQEATIDDLRWAGRRFATLTRADFQEIVLNAGLPLDIAVLVLEKLISRRNYLLELLNLHQEFSSLYFNSKITWGNVKQGKLTKFNYPGYPSEFAEADPESPIRRSEMYKYLEMSVLSTGMTSLLDKVNELLPQQMVSDVIARHGHEVLKKRAEQSVLNYLTGQNQTYSEPIGFWGGPTGNVNFSASRTIGTGTFYGSDAPLQLIDSVSARLNLGYMWAYHGLRDNLLPMVNSGLHLGRSFVHVRPIEDMNSGLRASWSDLMVSRFMPQLGRLIEPNPVCDLDKNPIWVKESLVDGQKWFEIGYDQDNQQGRVLAEQKKKEILTQQDSVAEYQITLTAVSKQEFCEKQIKAKINQNILSFVRELKTGESFVIIDTVGANLQAALSAPVATLIQTPIDKVLDKKLTLTAGAGADALILRRTMLVRTQTGLQIYLQNLNSASINYGVSLDFYVKLFGANQVHKLGEVQSLFFNLEIEGIDDTAYLKKVMRCLRALLIDHEAEILNDELPFYKLNHDLSASIFNSSFIFRHWDALKEDHELVALPPKKSSDTFNPQNFARKLYLSREVHRAGDNYYGLLDEIINSTSKGKVSLGGSPPGNNPAYSLLGKAQWTEISAEAEVTPNTNFEPMAIVDQVWAGWSISSADLMEVFNQVEERFRALNNNRKLINRGAFNTAKELQLYEVRSSLFFYPEGVRKLVGEIFKPKAEALNFLFKVLGKEHCEANLNTRASLKRGNIITCFSWAISQIMNMRAHFPQERTAQVKWIQNLTSILYNSAILELLLPAIGSDNYFFFVKVSGFKTNDADGSSKYLSNSIGSYQNEHAMGIFKEFSSQYGISSFEMYTRYFSQGF